MARLTTEREYVARLGAAELEVLGWIRAASNAALLVRLDGNEEELAVYKPDAGEQPLWDFPHGTLARREVAAFVLSDWLGWQVVPATIYRDGPEGPGSLQRFVPHDPQQHYFVLSKDPAHHDELRRMALFDLLANNADRKASHVLLSSDGIFGCDHGLCFHTENKVRTVIWDFAGEPIDTTLHADMRRLIDALETESELSSELVELIAPEEIAALCRRTRMLLASPTLPEPDEDRRPYPWPLF